jgi:hypothetical protein
MHLKEISGFNTFKIQKFRLRLKKQLFYQKQPAFLYFTGCFQTGEMQN